MTTGWCPMRDWSCPPRWPTTWVWGDWSTSTSTWARRPDGRTSGTEQQAIEGSVDEDPEERRRAEYTERLRALLPELRKVEGFPIGTDEDILALSDPPYYTACPNPFLGEFIAEHGTLYDEATDDYHREPFAADVSEGKNDPIYNAHSYHTKVPHKAIMRYILHYTKPGDIVFDGLGMTTPSGPTVMIRSGPTPDPSDDDRIGTGQALAPPFRARSVARRR